jgi:hypothetical protein
VRYECCEGFGLVSPFQGFGLSGCLTWAFSPGCNRAGFQPSHRIARIVAGCDMPRRVFRKQRNRHLRASAGLKARDVIAWGGARSAQPQDLRNPMSKALKGRHTGAAPLQKAERYTARDRF